MFPSVLLVGSLAKTNYGEPIFNLSTILMAVGIGTLAFILLTKGKIPFFLGPSFSYIGFTSYYVTTISNVQDIRYVRSTILWGYLLSGILLICMSILYRFKIAKKVIHFLFPNVVMGPAISLIGLELANTAISDSGFTGSNVKDKILAIITLVIIIVATLTKRKLLKNTSVFIGILSGCIIAKCMGMFEYSFILNSQWLKLPTIYVKDLLIVPDNMINLFISIIPSTIVAFTEIIGRVTVLDGMWERDNINNSQLMQNSLKAQSFANVFSIGVASIPITFYAENLAIMNLNNSIMAARGSKVQDEDSIVQNCYNPYSVYPYIMASILSILVACFGWLQNLFIAIPKAVLGAMELFIFALIASPGIQMLVDEKANYRKISNQIITASVLLAGVSSLVIEYKTFSLRGMGLGLTIGVTLNLLTKFLAYFGMLNENLELIEILDICIKHFSSKLLFFVSGNGLYPDKETPYTNSEICKLIVSAK